MVSPSGRVCRLRCLLHHCWSLPVISFGAPLDLVFTPFEVAAVTISVLIVGFVAIDGESNWMEGVMLVGVYVILAIAFFFLPA
jgi:Ca2+/H+ antiporter